jgi:hypothetical protein
MEATLKPLSNKAKNRFANVMGSNPNVVVEQVRDDAIFVVSANRAYSAWIKTPLNADWAFELKTT